MPSYPPPGLLDAIARATGFVSMRAGTYLDGHVVNVTSSSGAATATRMYLVPFWLPVAKAVDRIMVNVTVAGAAATVARLGIYGVDVSTYEPGALLLDAGTVATDTTGAKEATVSYTLAAGLFYAAVWCSGTPTLTTIASGNRPAVGNSSANGSPNPAFIKDGAYSGGLPNPAGTGLSSQSSCPQIQLRLA